MPAAPVTDVESISRPKSRERIETSLLLWSLDDYAGISRPKSRERIETCRAIHLILIGHVSPGPKAGSGLKHRYQ